LLIEDNMTNAVVIKNMLNKLGFTVDHAEDDHQALSLINTFSYELLVCDFHLGGYNLLDLYERFPEHIKSIPAIVLTGHASPALITLLKEEGFEYVLYKPVNSSELAQVIQRVL
jgi:CheY-like chemotaxis protein